jgi:phospholipid N-methyltransferase
MDLSVGEGLNDDNPSRQMTICGSSPRRARRMAKGTTTAVMLPVIECGNGAGSIPPFSSDMLVSTLIMMRQRGRK